MRTMHTIPALTPPPHSVDLSHSAQKPSYFYYWLCGMGEFMDCNNFISGFAANDPESTKMVWDLIDQRYDGKKCVFLNTRDDRRYRTLQLLDLVLKDIRPDMFIVRADNISNLLLKYDVNDIELKQFSMSATVDDVVDEIINLNSFNVLGIGNIVGWGEEFLQKIKVYRT